VRALFAPEDCEQEAGKPIGPEFSNARVKEPQAAGVFAKYPVRSELSIRSGMSFYPSRFRWVGLFEERPNIRIPPLTVDSAIPEPE
jgi:hypothetical protein